MSHSISPRFQQAAFDFLGLLVHYGLWDTPEQELSGRVDGLRRAQYLGANVTIPHKRTVMPKLDEIESEAELTGAVNTIVNRDGRLVGYNSDVYGFRQTLGEGLQFDPKGCRAAILGAGGAARAVLVALARGGAASALVLNRGPERAEALARDLRGRIELEVEIGPLDAHSVTRLAGCQLVVNCTPVGLAGGPAERGMPLPLEALPAAAAVVDVVANPVATPFLIAAAEQGHQTIGGLSMLVYQGALSFQLWTGREAPVDVMMAAAHAAMASRPPSSSGSKEEES